MFSRRSARAGAVVAVAALIGALSPGRTAAYCRLSTGMPEPGPIGQCSTAGLPLYWAQRCLSYSLVARTRDVPPFEDPDALDIRDVIDQSFASWMDATCGEGPLAVMLRQTEELAACDAPEHNRKRANANTIAFIEDWTERGLPPEAYGITLVWHDDATGEILDADMQLNEGSGRFDFCTGRCSGDGVDLQNVVTHEAGHFLGLGHSDEINASMYGDSVRGEIRKRLLSRDDVAGVCSIYGGGAAPVCTETDYLPRNGWGAACYRNGRDGGCRVATPGRNVPAAAWVWLLGAALAVAQRVHGRRRRRLP